MSLESPRFKFEDTLVKVEASQMVLQKGSTGTPVHLVQMALLDLGFSLPVSTGNPNFSPDGIFGEETKDAIKKFQKDSGTLTDDGIVGQKTLRELDGLFLGFDRSVKLHFRSLALTNVPFERSMRNAEIVYAQYGIKVEFASGESIALTPDQRDKFDQIDQECNWDLDDGEFTELKNLGTPAPLNDVLVFYVHTFADKNTLGCGGHTKARPACTVTANAKAWDTAHEVGHVLLTSGFAPVHIQDRRNLMHPISRSLSSTPVLTDRQVAQMRKSPQCRAI
jgi:hypothetical protein